MLVKQITKDECQHRGGWSSYCEWVEVYDDKGQLVAEVDEEHGEAYFPMQSKGKRSFELVEDNQCFPFMLGGVFDDYLEIEISGVSRKFYYYPNNLSQNSDKYDRKNTKRIYLKFNLNTDKELLEHLDKVQNKQGYIKSLILKDMGQQ